MDYSHSNIFHSSCERTASKMDCASFFTERVNHFDQERKLISKYKNLVTPQQSEMHQLSWETSQQQKGAEASAEEGRKVIEETELAKKELAYKREELLDMREAQHARKNQLVRLSQLAQPIESDVTYVFNERAVKRSGHFVESAPIENQLLSASAVRQTKTGDLIQLEHKIHEITKLSHLKFTDFDTEFVDANIVSSKCEKQVNDRGCCWCMHGRF